MLVEQALYEPSHQPSVLYFSWAYEVMFHCGFFTHVHHTLDSYLPLITSCFLSLLVSIVPYMLISYVYLRESRFQSCELFCIYLVLGLVVWLNAHRPAAYFYDSVILGYQNSTPPLNMNSSEHPATTVLFLGLSFIFETGLAGSQAGLIFLGTSCPPASASQAARMTGVLFFEGFITVLATLPERVMLIYSAVTGLFYVV